MTMVASAADQEIAQLQGNWHTWGELRDLHTGYTDGPHPEHTRSKCELPIAAVCPSSDREDSDEEDYATSGAVVFPCGHPHQLVHTAALEGPSCPVQSPDHDPVCQLPDISQSRVRLMVNCS